jgi:hypothetical protein
MYNLTQLESILGKFDIPLTEVLPEHALQAELDSRAQWIENLKIKIKPDEQAPIGIILMISGIYKQCYSKGYMSRDGIWKTSQPTWDKFHYKKRL